MSSEDLVMRYKCSKCQMRYPEMTEDGKCYRPSCKGPLVDIRQSLSSADIYWHEDAFEVFPGVLAHEYHRLYELCCADNIYGTILQLKDVIEATVKLVVLSVSAWAKVQDIPGRQEAYEKELANEVISFGGWFTLNSLIKNFFTSKKYKGAQPPESLGKLLLAVSEWETENKSAHWRNETIGHGALALEDDPEIYTETVNKINAVSGFYRQLDAEIRAVHMQSEGLSLTGKDNARDLPVESGKKCSAEVDGVGFSLDPYILHVNSGIYFYDEYADSVQQRLICYPVGKKHFQPNGYVAELSAVLQDKGSVLKTSEDSKVITRGEDDFLNLLNAENKGLRPDNLIKEIRSWVSDFDKGVFLLEMERGCGKSFLSQKLNCRYEGCWEISGDVDVRTYHLSRTQYGGVPEFLDGIRSEWEDSYKRSAEAKRVRFTLERSKENPVRNAGFMAEYLKNWQEYTAGAPSRDHKPKILLILDGLDEIREKDEEIWSFIPGSDQLEEGVYILLTGRIADQEELPEYYKRKIKALKLSADPLKVLADSDVNREFLRNYIKSRPLGIKDEVRINQLTETAHCRILELAMICSMLQAGAEISTAQPGDWKTVQAFLRTIEERYGEPKAPEFRTLLAVLAEVACYEPLSVREIADLMQMGSVRLELYGMLSDIAPLITVDRSFVLSGNQYSDMNRYHLSDDDVIQAVREYLGEDLKSVVSDLFAYAQLNMQSSNPVACGGMIALMSHITDTLKRNGIVVFWSAADLEGVYKMLQICADAEKPDGLVDLRISNLTKEIVSIGSVLDVLNREEAIDYIIDSYLILLQMGDPVPNFLYSMEMFDVADKAEYRNDIQEAYNLCRAYTAMAELNSSQDLACQAIEKAEFIAERYKDARFLKAQAEAYVMFLSVDENADPERVEADELLDRTDVARKAVDIADSLYSGPKDRIDIDYVKCYIRYAEELDHDGDSALAENYYKKCLNSMLEKEKTVGLSARETDTLVELYAKTGDHYFRLDDAGKVSSALMNALTKLKSILHASVFVAPFRIITRYTLLMWIAKDACEGMPDADFSVAKDIFSSALDYFESIILDSHIKDKADDFIGEYGFWMLSEMSPDSDIELQRNILRAIKASVSDTDSKDKVKEEDDEEEDEAEEQEDPEGKTKIDSLLASAEKERNWQKKSGIYLQSADQYVDIGEYEDAEKAYSAAMAVCQRIAEEPVQDEEHLDAHIDYAFALYKTARFYSMYVEDFKKKRLWVGLAEKSLDIHTRLNDCDIFEGDQIIAELCCHLGQYYAETLQKDKTKALYSKALEIYRRLHIYPDRVSKMQSWFQEQDRFSLRGKIHWRFVSDYQGSDTKDPKEMLVLCMRQGASMPEMYFSRDSLLAIVGTDKEKEFFFSLMDMINGRDICFVFKRGGGLFENKTLGQLTEEIMAEEGVDIDQAREEARVQIDGEYLGNGFEWNRVFEQLRLKGDLLEVIEDKYSEWVGEFFSKLWIYAHNKYPQSFGDYMDF